jgi:site-specific recombinase XerD
LEVNPLLFQGQGGVPLPAGSIPAPRILNRKEVNIMIDAKVSFMNQLKEQMASKLTMEQIGELTAAGFRLLDHFEMFEAADDDNQADDMLDSYVSALKVECRSQKTIDRYVYVIKKLMDFAKVPTRRISVYHLRNYLTQEKERGICENTLEGYREIFSAYFNWLQRESLIDKNPCVNLGVIKVPKKEKKTYSDAELERLNWYCGNIRNRAILHFLRSTGCRISEVTELDREAVNLEALECVVHGKGNKERTVYLDEVAGMLLSQYLSERTDDAPALFVNRCGNRLKPGGVREMLKVLADKAGVEHVHPHKFRRTLATDLTRHGMPIQEVAKILGHEKLDTTMKYVVLNKDDIKASYRRFA